MTLLIGFLTFILVVNCLFLILLVLIQLPKKEAGAGIAFGGAATDALFGAGSGNALTKMTKYSATLFVGMAVLLSVLNMQAVRQGSRRLEEEISKQAAANPARLAPALPTNTIARTAPAATGAVTQATPASPATNLLMSTGTNQALKPAPAVTPEAQTAAPATTTPAAPATPTPAPPK